MNINEREESSDIHNYYMNLNKTIFIQFDFATNLWIFVKWTS